MGVSWFIFLNYKLKFRRKWAKINKMSIKWLQKPWTLITLNSRQIKTNKSNSQLTRNKRMCKVSKIKRSLILEWEKIPLMNIKITLFNNTNLMSNKNNRNSKNSNHMHLELSNIKKISRHSNKKKNKSKILNNKKHPKHKHNKMNQVNLCNKHSKTHLLSRDRQFNNNNSHQINR